MSADGIPETSTRRFGEAVARLRNQRGWSRTKLINRLHGELGEDTPNRDGIGETWLARLETGRMVKVPRDIVEALCRALGCTPFERARVLLWADRNILASTDEPPDSVAEMLNYVMDQLYSPAREVLIRRIGQGHGHSLDEQEQFELVATALELVLAKQRSIKTFP